jgi:hypothetical protein
MSSQRLLGKHQHGKSLEGFAAFPPIFHFLRWRGGFASISPRCRPAYPLSFFVVRAYLCRSTYAVVNYQLMSNDTGWCLRHPAISRDGKLQSLILAGKPCKPRHQAQTWGATLHANSETSLPEGGFLSPRSMIDCLSRIRSNFRFLNASQQSSCVYFSKQAVLMRGMEWGMRFCFAVPECASEGRLGWV